MSFTIVYAIFVSAVIPRVPETVDKILGRDDARSSYTGENEYPFSNQSSDNEAALSGGRLIVAIKNMINNVSYFDYKVDEIEKKVTDIMNSESYIFGIPLLHLNRAWSKYICGMNMTTAQSGSVLNGETVLELGNGYLTFYTPVDDAAADNVKKLSDFQKKIESEGRDFLFFKVPHKTGELSDDYMGAIKDNAIQKEKYQNELIRKYNINCVYCKDYMENEGLDNDSSYFITDHHWTPEAGLKACGYLADALNKTAGYKIDTSIFDEENYNIETEEDSFLGSQGRKVTRVYTRPEDFPVVVPKYKTNLTVFLGALNKTLTGGISETLFNYDMLKGKSVYDRWQFHFYGYGDQSLVEIHNNNLKDGKRILVLKESYANFIYPYMCGFAEDVDVIDLRHFKGSVNAYIEKNDPDTVVMIYSHIPDVEVLTKE